MGPRGFLAHASAGRFIISMPVAQGLLVGPSPAPIIPVWKAFIRWPTLTVHRRVENGRSGSDPPYVQLLGDVETHIKVFQSFGEAQDSWQKAECSCTCYGFQTFQWQSTYIETIGAAEGAEPKIVHVTDAAGNSLMLLPLEIRRRFGLSVLSFIGGHPTDYHAPIICPIFAASLGPNDCERLVACVLELLPLVDVIAFEKMPSTIEGVPNPFVRLKGATHHRNSHVATLDRTFHDFKARRKSAFFATAVAKAPTERSSSDEFHYRQVGRGSGSDSSEADYAKAATVSPHRSYR